MKIFACAKPPIIAFSRLRESNKWINCSDCKYSKTINDHKTVCILFKYLTVSEQITYVDTIRCRSDFDLCGPYAEFFKPKKDNFFFEQI